MSVVRRPDRVVIITRATGFEELVARFNSADQAAFYLKMEGQDFAPIRAAHERYHAALAAVRQAVPAGLKQIVVDRMLVPQFEFRDDIVVVVGQDGLVSNAAKYLGWQPLLGVNPDPDAYEGVLLPWRPETVGRGIADFLAGKAKVQKVTLAQAETKYGRRLLAFNDLFIGPARHGSARYHITFGGESELQSSSGIIVSTGAGSTGWLSSIHAGACAIARALGRDAPEPAHHGSFDRAAEKLVFSVREPWPSKTTGTGLVYGEIKPGQKLVLASQMPTGGLIFSDGMDWDALDFNAGTEVTISIAPQKTLLVLP